MSDTQWPRFEVFEQARPDQPHRNTGAVHAPDAEMALQNARDVFERRPECHSLWVVPASQILARTAEELAEEHAQGVEAPAVPGGDGLPLEAFLVFHKQSQRQGDTFVTHVGEVQAASAEAALRQALHASTGQPVFVWWVVPQSAITASDPADAEPLFAPARDKPFRLPKNYHVQTQMREVKTAPSPDPAP